MSGSAERSKQPARDRLSSAGAAKGASHWLLLALAVPVRVLWLLLLPAVGVRSKHARLHSPGGLTKYGRLTALLAGGEGALQARLRSNISANL